MHCLCCLMKLCNLLMSIYVSVYVCLTSFKRWSHIHFFFIIIVISKKKYRKEFKEAKHSSHSRVLHSAIFQFIIHLLILAVGPHTFVHVSLSPHLYLTIWVQRNYFSINTASRKPCKLIVRIWRTCM